MTAGVPSEESLPLSAEMRIDAVCVRFEAAWKAVASGGARPAIEAYLGDAADAERAALLRELLALDLDYRKRGSERPAPDDYRPWFPEHAEVIERLFAEQNQAAGRGPEMPGGGPGQEAGADPESTVAPGPPQAVKKAAVVQADWPVVPGYEILSELGRGGMGVVYRVRHLALKRTVALKMILAGAHAGAEELARFRAEAEAVARLQHPHIIQIHEVGEHAGLPYFSLEFCPGGSLAQKLSGTPLPPGEAAALVEQLARAVQAAHDKGILHRDLKPANVLLAEDGTPRITDFGLAKRLDRAGQTASGAVIGTPSYMAPEQAGGKSKELTATCDVYALGAILYECLTGRPPFRAATPVDTMLQVVSDEPVPPAQLNARVPVDLETVCLKCLHKDPGKRYESAAALADDLQRWQKGEPVRARPVGRLDKVRKWARRNPALAASLTAVALVLLASTAVSTYFYAAAAQRAEGEAKQKSDEFAAVDALAKTSEELTQKSQALETTLAASLLVPLGAAPPQAASNSGSPPADPLTEEEMEALRELAESRDAEVTYRFVTEALSSPEKTRQLKRRAGPALQAAVGLSLERRQKVEALLLGRLNDPAASAAQRVDVALVAGALGDLTPETTARVAQVLSEGITKADDHLMRSEMAQDLAALAPRMDSKDAASAAAALARVSCQNSEPLGQALWVLTARREARDAAMAALSQAVKDNRELTWYQLAQSVSVLGDRLEPNDAAPLAAAVAKAMRDNKDPFAWPALSALADRMPPKDAAVVCGQAADILSKILDETLKDKKSSGNWQWLTRGLAEMAHRMELKDAAVVCAPAAAALTQTLKDNKDASNWQSLPQDLSSLAAHLDANDAALDAAILGQALKDNKDPSGWSALASALSDVAARLEPKDAAAVCAPVAALLTRNLQDNKDPKVWSGLAQGLSAVARRLDRKDAALDAAALSKALQDNKEPKAWSALAHGLSALAARMDPKDAAVVCSSAAAALSRASKEDEDPNAWLALAPHLEGKDAVLAATALAKAIRREDPSIWSYVTAVSELAARLEPRDAVAVLSLAISRTSNEWESSALWQDLSAAAARMDPKEAAQVAANLAQALKDNKDAGAWEALEAVAARLEPKDAAQVATTLSEILKDNEHSDAWPSLARALSAVAARLDAKGAAQVAADLSQALKDNKHADASRWLAQALSAVAGRLEPREAAVVCTKAAATLIQAIKDSEGSDALAELAQGLSALADRMEAKEAALVCAQAAAAITRAMKANKNPPNTLRVLPDGLAALAGHLEPKDAAEAAAAVSEAIKRSKDPTVSNARSDVLLVLAARMEPQAGSAVSASAGSAVSACAVAELIRTIRGIKDSQPDQPEWQTHALWAMAARLDAKDAAIAAAALIPAIKDTQNIYVLSALADGLSAVVARMEPREAAATLAGAIARETDPDAARILGQAFSSIRPDESPEVQRERSLSAATTLAVQAGDVPPLASLGFLTLAAKPLPWCVSTPDLIELLKQPLCVGVARRAVLDQLEVRYHRPFADQWEFIHFAQGQHLGLDFATPPRLLATSAAGGK
jgi:hypothetical protein